MERWKTVFEGFYEVSDHGRIRRMDTGHILTAWGRRYPKVTLSIRGVRKAVQIHQLVAQEFIGPCPQGKEVNHKDGVKKNIHYKNLEYMTPSQNHLHAVALGLHRSGERCNLAKLTESAVIDIKRRLLNGEARLAIAKSYKVGKHTIGSIARGNSWAGVEV
jgi:hypothetical protein